MKYVAALILTLTGCIGYGEFISPAEAQRIERAQCEQKQDADERRGCLSMVARKYSRYNGEGGYPSDPRAGTCGGSADCRGW